MAYKKAENIPGLINNEQVQFLKDYASDVPKNMCIVEIGPFTGKSTAALAQGADESVVIYTCDLWGSNDRPITGSGMGIAESRDHSFELFKENIRKAGVHQRVFHTTGDSAETGRAWPDDAADIGLMYIDGDHRYPGVKADLDAWLDKVAPGAPVILDDYFSNRGVRRAVDELCEQTAWGIVDQTDRFVVIQEDID